MNNVRNSIGWADYTWNPVTGCKRGCSYCYARRMHERFSGAPFSVVVLHPERFEQPGRVRKPSRIFVGSMSDIFYWPREWTQAVVEEVAKHRRHTFMFLSKTPTAYAGVEWPANTMQGLTFLCDLVTPELQKQVVDDFVGGCPRPYLSIEPILGPLKADVGGACEVVIVGAMSGPRAVRPEQEWVESVKRHVRADKIFWKTNIRKYAGTDSSSGNRLRV